MAIVIGSLAAHVHCPLQWGTYNDIDLVMWEDEFDEVWCKTGQWTIFGCSEFGISYVGRPFGPKGRIVEVTTVARDAENSTSRMLRYMESVDALRTTRILGKDVPVVPLKWLYALKRSHIYVKDSPHFAKTMRDVHILRGMMPESVVPHDDRLKLPLPSGYLGEWTRLRIKETYARQHHPNLNVKKKDFFSDEHGVHYTYDHDTIHLAMSREGLPAYELYKEPGAEVKCSKALFWEQCTHEDRIRGVLEECYVLALERSQVPHPGACTPRDSFLMALKGVCTRITSGWFREFAAGHYFEVLAAYSDDYVDRFRAGVDSGLVQPAHK